MYLKFEKVSFGYNLSYCLKKTDCINCCFMLKSDFNHAAVWAAGKRLFEFKIR